MKITYEVFVQSEPNVLSIRLTPEAPINGFYGAELRIVDVPTEERDAWILERVKRKVSQELGETAQAIILTKA